MLRNLKALVSDYRDGLDNLASLVAALGYYRADQSGPIERDLFDIEATIEEIHAVALYRGRRVSDEERAIILEQLDQLLIILDAPER